MPDHTVRLARGTIAVRGAELEIATRVELQAGGVGVVGQIIMPSRSRAGLSAQGREYLAQCRAPGADLAVLFRRYEAVLVRAFSNRNAGAPPKPERSEAFKLFAERQITQADLDDKDVRRALRRKLPGTTTKQLRLWFEVYERIGH